MLCSSTNPANGLRPLGQFALLRIMPPVRPEASWKGISAFSTAECHDSELVPGLP